MEQAGNSVNRLSGADHLISDQDHMGEIIERIQGAQQQAEQSQSSGQQQQGADRHASRQNDNRTRQAY